MGVIKRIALVGPFLHTLSVEYLVFGRDRVIL